ncbi:MAG TPA: cytochrome d ubiquinol oxidase subunit II [Sumerlaeia bacterium]|nr:cytochrome d ubiquinol oxidase subunit II [Sumerlaeia bacterium]
MLESIWFILWGVLWAVYFMLDGFDLGAGALLPFLAKNEEDRRTVYRAIGPYWDGNEVWLIAAGGVTFAAFPTTYAVMFSALYTPLMLILFALIFRGAAVALRPESEGEGARKAWDWCFVLGSFTAALLLGVAFANLFRGVPIDRKGIFHGTLLTLLNPYGILGGALFALLFATHGALWLAHKCEGDVQARAAKAAARLWIALVAAAVLFLTLTPWATPLFANYLAHPALFGVPAVGLLALLFARVPMAKGAWLPAWAFSSAAIVAVALFGVIGMYPALLPSSLSSDYSMTIHNSASSPKTLRIMLGVVLVLVPIVIAYQAWVYWAFRGKVPAASTDEEFGY